MSVLISHYILLWLQSTNSGNFICTRHQNCFCCNIANIVNNSYGLTESDAARRCINRFAQRFGAATIASLQSQLILRLIRTKILRYI